MSFFTSLTDQHPEVSWGQIVGFRIILIHATFGIDWEIVREAARNRCPLLRKQVQLILDALYGKVGTPPNSP